jgi:hypothetical protein
MNSNMVRPVVALVITGLLTGGCTSGVEPLDGQAAPTGAAAPASAPTSPAATSPAAPPATSPASLPSVSPPAATPVLGPDGLGRLKLLMTRKQAEATRLIEGYRVEDFTGNCGVAELVDRGSTVYFTPGLGLSSINAPDGVRTPQGIRVGSAISDVQRAYPDWEEILGGGDTGYGWADVPGSDGTMYRIDVRDGKVTDIALTAEGQKCIE